MTEQRETEEYYADFHDGKIWRRYMHLCPPFPSSEEAEKWLREEVRDSNYNKFRICRVCTDVMVTVSKQSSDVMDFPKAKITCQEAELEAELKAVKEELKDKMNITNKHIQELQKQLKESVEKEFEAHNQLMKLVDICHYMLESSTIS